MIWEAMIKRSSTDVEEALLQAMGDVSHILHVVTVEFLQFVTDTRVSALDKLTFSGKSGVRLIAVGDTLRGLLD